MKLFINQKQSPIKNGQDRNTGIDLLRLITDLYIIILHTLGLGGILGNLQKGTTQYKVFWFIEIWVFCAVNIFVIISGFAGFTTEEKKTDWSKYIMLWMQVVFYGVCIAVIYKQIHPEAGSYYTIRDMFFPLTNDIYWYFSAYTGLYIIKPFLNAAVRSLEKATLKRLMIIIFIAFCCFSMYADPFRMTDGYSFSWFVILYLIGASLKKCETAEKVSAWKAFLGIMLPVLLTLFLKILDFNFQIMNIHFHPGILISYISPMTVSAAVFHVILFSKVKLPGSVNKIIAFFSPGVFAVYLINTHPFLWLNEFENRFAAWSGLRTVSAVFRVLCYSVIFVIISLLLDKIRQYLFLKLKIQPAFRKIINGQDRLGSQNK